MCEAISCRDSHPGVSGSWLLLTGLAVLTVCEIKGAVDGSMVELGEAWQAAGEVMRDARVSVGGRQAAPLGERAWGGGALILHR